MSISKQTSMIFGFGKTSSLGIEIGASSIKAVELTQKEKKPFLLNYGEVPINIGMKRDDGSTYSVDQVISLSLQALVKRMKPRTKQVSVSLPAFTGLIALIEMPEMREKELDQAIQFEAHKYIPSPLDEVSLSWDVARRIEDSQSGSRKLEILLVAALKKDVLRYAKFVADAGLTMKLLELETFSLVRAMASRTTGVHILVDIGARSTNLVLIHDGLIKVSRSLDTGGNDMTRTIMEGLEISDERAESMKKGDKDLLNHPESALVFPALQAMSSEVTRICSIYQAKHSNVKIESIILSGGSSHMTGLAKFFQKTLNVPVAVADPWQMIMKPKKSEVPDDDSFAVAIGLALGGMDDKKTEKKFIEKKKGLWSLISKRN